MAGQPMENALSERSESKGSLRSSRLERVSTAVPDSASAPLAGEP